MQWAYNVTLRQAGITNVDVEKEYLIITSSECVFVPLVIPYANNFSLKHFSF